ncbi:MAG: Uma2 family endonuclease [Endozoicomonadaceae bacterium]|nr:Uma2 family endonuclease [Endozoicomonadaceae bacterium]
MPVNQHPVVSPEDYLTQEREAEFKSEYLNGDVYAMAGASRNHNQITSNLVVSLGGQLATEPCGVYVSDMKVRTRTLETNKYSYPDVVVTCGEELFEDNQGDVLLNPQIIIEVLSNSTEAYDRGLKFFHYQLIPSLQEYLLVSQHYCRVEHYQRRADKQWVYSEFHQMKDNVPLSTVDCSLKVVDIYRRVIWK